MMGKKIKVAPTHEQAILGTMIADSKIRRKLAKSLSPNIFFLNQHKLIFAALQQIVQERLEYIPATLKSLIPPGEAWDGVAYLDKLSKLSAVENIDYHVSHAEWDTIRNTLLTDRIPNLQAQLQDVREDSDSIYNTMKNMLGIVRQTSSSAVATGQTHIAQYNADLYARNSGNNIRTSGYMALDRKLTSPFKPGWLSVIAAAPSIGKTTFALNMAARQAKKWKVGYLAWESGNNAATDIICASQLKIPIIDLIKRPHKIPRKKKEEQAELLDNLFGKNGNLSFLNRPPHSLLQEKQMWAINDTVIDWVDSQIEEWGIDILYWDLFEKMLADRRPQAIAWALDRIQQLAQKHNIHIALLHQILLKEAERQDDKRPSRYNLKGTGGYIETPDMVFGLYRRAVYERGIEDSELELICLKQRLGPWPFRLIFDWEGQYTRVSGGREEQLTYYEDEDEGV
jgi:replicative DNA helicase